MKKCGKDTIEKIIKLEKEMFIRVPTRNNPPCREDIEAFKIHRKNQFSVWSEKTCQSYMKDLIEAEFKGDNLMTLKYARMDNLILSPSGNVLIGRIISQFIEWQKEVIDEYPNVMKGARDIDGFAKYLKAEMQTYSDKTIEYLWGDVKSYIKEGSNMSLELYKALANLAGYKTLKDMESALKSK